MVRTSLVLTAVLALAFAPTAAAHRPFKDGPGSAKRIAAYLNKKADFVDVTCRYTRPHVRCRGLVRETPRTDVYYRFTASFHKVTATKGFYIVCVTTVWESCKRFPMTYSR